jgi:hypothetical protein
MSYPETKRFFRTQSERDAMEASMQQSIANMAHFEASRMYHTQEVARQIRNGPDVVAKPR